MDETCTPAGPVVSRIKHLARLLQRKARDGDPQALDAVQPLLLEGECLQRRHCLLALSHRLGFRSWTQARSVLDRAAHTDRGLFMYRESHGALCNIWSASYDEAASIRQESGGYLLPFARQFMVVEAPFVDWLGLDPQDPDWDAMGRDWVVPTDGSAWDRLANKRVDVLLAA